MTQNISKQDKNSIIDVINHVVSNYRKNSRLWMLITRKEDIFISQLISDVNRCLSRQDLCLEETVELNSQDERDVIVDYVKNTLKIEYYD